MEKEFNKSDKECEKEEFIEFTIYTFFQPPGSEKIYRADMPIDVLRIKREEF